MKALLSIITVAVLTLSFAALAVSAEEIPVITDQNRELGAVLSGTMIGHDGSMKTGIVEVFPAYKDFPTIADLKARELGAVLSKAFASHETWMKGAAAGGLGASGAVRDVESVRTILGPGGSDLP